MRWDVVVILRSAELETSQDDAVWRAAGVFKATSASTRRAGSSVRISTLARRRMERS